MFKGFKKELEDYKNQLKENAKSKKEAKEIIDEAVQITSTRQRFKEEQNKDLKELISTGKML
jgi:Sec-independent protein translocase protein TatA